ncbi:MAG: hypothetical protein MUO60_19605, partial [Clostridiaceae bacterium]|nr:hypothetical protein [Clostridiaceae bacterium]
MMQNTDPYQIQNVQLDQADISQITAPELGKRYYYVFWWRFIPLGHFYKEKGRSIDFIKEIVTVITPVLKNYKANQEGIKNIIEAFKCKDFLKFSKLMDQI